MVLLTEAMPLIQVDDFLVGKRQACPPSFQFDVGLKKHLPLLVYGPFGNAHDPAKDNGSLDAVGICEGVLLLDAEQGNPLAGTRDGDLHPAAKARAAHAALLCWRGFHLMM